MKSKLLLSVLCVAVIACVSLLLIVNPGWKAQETLYDSHYTLQANGLSNGTVGSWNLVKGDLLYITTTVKTGQAELLIDEQTVNPSLAATWERVVFNGTGTWQETFTVPATNKYFIDFLLYGNVTSASIDEKCIREYTQHIIP
jgi:hypothetical protein